MSSSYFGSHSGGGGKIRVTNSSDLLAALKIQTIYNANQSNPKSRIRTAGHTNPAEMQAQFNAVAQQINYGVKFTQNFQPDPPSAPSIVATTPLNRSVRVSWDAPSSDGGGEITSYSLRATNQSSGAVTTQTSGGATPRVYTFTGLTNGTGYKFSVAAINSAGVGAYSALSGTVTPSAGYPGVPTNVTVAVLSNTSITVGWTAPADNGGSAITNYTVYAYADGALVETSSQPVGSAATSVGYTGLTTGTTYYFKVAAWTSVTGGGPTSQRSDPSANIIPCGATSAPGTPAGVAADRAVSLTWTVPSNLNGSQIDYYQIEVLDSAGSPLPVPRTVNTPNDDLTYTVTGLTNATTYKFKVNSVTTINAFTSAKSAASAGVTPAVPIGGTTPTAPQSLTANYTNINAAVGKGVNLAWLAPSTGAPSRYVVARRLAGSGDQYADIKYVGGSILTCVIEDGDETPGGNTIDIPNGTQYQYVVYAQKFTVAVPTGPNSNAVLFTAASSPTWDPVDGGLTVTQAGVGELAITWDAAQANGSDIAEYRLYLSPNSTPGSYITISSPVPRSRLLTGLPIAPTYIWLKAVNEVGVSDFVDPAVIETPRAQAGDYTPDAPSITSVANWKDATTGDLGAEITYTYDSSPGTHIFTATATKQSDNTETVVSPLNAGTFQGLVAGQEYIFTLYDTFEGVDSAYSNPSTSLLISDVPAQISAAPTIESVGDGQVTISWTAPSSDAPITGYEIKIQGLNSNQVIPTGTTSTTYIADGLDNGSSYTFAVRALNGLETNTGYAAQDFSDASDAGIPIPPGATEVAPDTPAVAPTAVVGDASVTLVWTFSGSSGSANGVPTDILQYVIYSRVSGVGSYTELARVDTNDPFGGILIDTGLTNGTAYQFKYSVVNGNTTTNESGQSPAVTATPTAPAPGQLPPGQPDTLAVTYDPTGFQSEPGWSMTWVSGGGGPVDYYSVVFSSKNEDDTEGPSTTLYVFSPTTELVVSAEVGGQYEYGIYQFSVQASGPGGNSDTANFP
jgi:hypothetical protein